MLLPVQPCRLPSPLTRNFHRRRTCRRQTPLRRRQFGGVVEETITGVLKLKETVTKGELLLLAIDVKDCAMKPKFDIVFFYHHSLNDEIMRVTDVMTDGKCALVSGYGDVSNSSAFALRDSGGRVVIADCDTICALQVGMEKFQAAAIESVVLEMDRLVSSMGSVCSSPLSTPFCVCKRAGLEIVE